jgi:hypothetical protein
MQPTKAIAHSHLSKMLMLIKVEMKGDEHSPDGDEEQLCEKVVTEIKPSSHSMSLI